MTPELGVCYYPEHWPEEMWAQDAADMAASGITWVRIGEFAWSRIEPSPGAFDFDWLDRAIDVLAQAGLKIVLGTPSCTPPRWMLDRFPDMLPVGADGHERRFGSRRHYCFSHDGYRDAAAQIAAVLGDRYGRDPRIHAWQIDNEYDCHDTVLSYSQNAKTAFQAWLQDTYGSIDALNTAWGTVFWSMEYARFDQIDLPNQTVTQAHPSHDLAFRRFTSVQVVRFHEAQVEVLRARTDAPLIHNYMGRILAFDHFAVGASIDIASWDSYPLGFLLDRVDGDDAHRARYLQQGDPDFQAFHHDLYRAVGKGRWWVMEQQPGPVNWAPWNPAPLPGMVRLWTWEAFAHGAEVVSYFRWRQAPFAQEQMHSGLKRPDNAEAEGMAETQQVAAEIADLSNVTQTQAPVALIFDYASAWTWDVLPQGADFSYFRLVMEAYRALRRNGLSVDILPPSVDDLSGYTLVLAPGLAQVPDGMARALAGTASIIGPRANAVTEELTIPTPMGPDLPGLDVTVTRVESLPPGHTRPVGTEGCVAHWQEHVAGDAPVLLRTDGGVPVLLGQNGMHYLAAWPDADLWDSVLSQVAGPIGLPLTPLPDGLRLRETETYQFAFNYAPKAIDWNGETLLPGGVIWYAHQRVDRA